MLRAPCLEPPLHGPQKAVGIAIGMLALQLVEDLAARPPRLLVEPGVAAARSPPRVGRGADVRVSAWVSAAQSAAPRPSARPSAARRGTSRAAGRLGGRARPRRRSRPAAAGPPGCRAEGGPDPTSQSRLEPIADLVGRSRVRQQPLAGRRRRMIALADARPVALLLRQLERGLEEVHEQPHRRIEFRQRRARPPGPRAAGSRRSAARPRRSSARPRPGRSCGRAGTGERDLLGGAVIPHGLVHEHGVVVGVEAEQRERQVLAHFLQHRDQQRLLAHQQRRAFGPAGGDVGQHQRLHEAAVAIAARCARPGRLRRSPAADPPSRRRSAPGCSAGSPAACGAGCAPADSSFASRRARSIVAALIASRRAAHLRRRAAR